MCCIAVDPDKRQCDVLGSLQGEAEAWRNCSPILNLVIGSLPTDEFHLVLGRIIQSNLQKGNLQHFSK